MIKAPKWSSILKVINTLADVKAPLINVGSTGYRPSALVGIRIELRKFGKPVGGANKLAEMMGYSKSDTQISWPHFIPEWGYTPSGREYWQLAGEAGGRHRTSKTSIYAFSKKYFGGRKPDYPGDNLAKEGAEKKIGLLYKKFNAMQAEGQIPKEYEFGITAFGRKQVYEKAYGSAESIFEIFDYQSRPFSKGKYPHMEHSVRDVNYYASRIERPSTNLPMNPIDRGDHGGTAEILRKELTDFGSAWQGIRRSLKLASFGIKQGVRNTIWAAKDITRGAKKLEPLALGTLAATGIHMATHSGVVADIFQKGIISPLEIGTAAATAIATKWGYEAIKHRKSLIQAAKFTKSNPQEAKTIASMTLGEAKREVRAYVGSGTKNIIGTAAEGGRITPGSIIEGALSEIQRVGGHEASRVAAQAVRKSVHGNMSPAVAKHLLPTSFADMDRISRPSSNVIGNIIEGMPHGGVAEKIRKFLTDFGSAWRGLIKVPQAFFDISGEKSLLAASVSLDKETLGIVKGVKDKNYQRVYKEMLIAKKKGFKSIVVVSDKLRGDKLRTTIKHERTHQFDPHLNTGYDEFNLPSRSWEEVVSLGYKDAQIPGEFRAMAAEARYMATKTKDIAIIDDIERVGGEYLLNMRQTAVDIANSNAVLPTVPKGMFVNPRQTAYFQDRIPKAHEYLLNSQYVAMRNSTDMVKANLSGFTIPGVAMSPKRGGSRQGPRGGM